MRARSTTSLLASIRALVSRARGAISSGNFPAKRSALPERIAASPSVMRLSGAKPKRTWNVVVSNNTAASMENVMISAWSKERISSEISAASPATVTEVVTFVAEIDIALDKPEPLILGTRDIPFARTVRASSNAVFLQVR